MKKFNIVILAAMVLVVTLTGCGQSTTPVNSDSGEKISVVTTIFPPYDFVREIAGEKAELSMLLPPGSESHSFEPTPQDIITIQNCDIFIYVGGESDEWVEEVLESMDTSKMEIITLMDCVEVVEEKIVEGMEDEEEDPDGDGGDEPEYDEHVWTSPRNAKLIVQKIAAVMGEADSANASVYQENTDAYLSRLTQLDADFQTVVDQAVRKTIVFGDRFPFRYFADAYGLDYFAAFPGCSTETEPSAATIAFLIDKVNDEEIPAVLYIEFSNGKIADTICETTGAKKLLLHSCHNISKDDFAAAVSYLDLMTQNVETLKEALQ